tara:strand:+ start:201 stop:911 length:711 start_codon:yes stop_codon:yes gene_type:complete
MALPKINQAIRYETIIPSSQKKITYRPYFVKEEKILMQSYESDDEGVAMRAMMDTVVACVYDTIVPTNLTTYDIEFLFTQIRAKSVGEKSKIIASCIKEDCEIKTNLTVNLMEVKVQSGARDDVKDVIELSDNILLELKYPSFESYVSIWNEEKTDAEFGMDMIPFCIKAIISGEDRITDWGEEEILEFIDSMTTEQFAKITEFIENAPSLKHELEFDCECGQKNKAILEGLSDFF